jgi:hypothetical protein
MSLSDSCFDAITDLTHAFHHYLDWNYGAEHMGKLASAILELAEIAYALNYEPEIAAAFKAVHGEHKPIKLIAECCIVADLIADPENHEVYQAAVTTVGLVAQINPRIRAAIVNAYYWQQSPAGVSEKLRMDNPISFEAVYRRIYPEQSHQG